MSDCVQVPSAGTSSPRSGVDTSAALVFFALGIAILN
ncbi:unnamed protein product [Acanthoscelides obtectus]|uniref:Uncharacterized protein n=1 Tax=Acanthoscelides obtectus TaxID=200917 RepID=A0A9P0NSW2_ACAOB|nr:unnamed protein product [Acanthoscelides obtectus]CAK1621162.1 hypothetical protein AOBTE_LOCUS799 [Acanthoscelides obtectus]